MTETKKFLITGGLLAVGGVCWKLGLLYDARVAVSIAFVYAIALYFLWLRDV